MATLLIAATCYSHSHHLLSWWLHANAVGEHICPQLLLVVAVHDYSSEDRSYRIASARLTQFSTALETLCYRMPIRQTKNMDT